MSSAEAFKTAMAELRQEQAAAIAVHRADSKALMDLTAKLNAALQGQITDVDVADLAQQIHQAAVDLHSGIVDSHTGPADVKTANQDQSIVQGGQSTGPDVVSASSPGTITPEATPDESSQAVPSSLGGGAMPKTDVTISEKAPGSPVPASAPEPEEKPAEPLPPKGDDKPAVVEPPVPSVEDVPSSVHDNAPDSAKKD